MDVRLVLNADGADLVFKGNDIEQINGLQNMPLLGFFGGNVEQSTSQVEPDEERFDYWANDFLFINDESIQFNSLLERTLLNTALNSAGLLEIEQAVITDLQFMLPFASVSADVTLLAADRLSITIRINQPELSPSDEFTYIWDNTKSELIVT